MPMTVITVTKAPPSLRGDLTKWMQEIAVGVYIGNFNSKVREQLWKRVTQSIGAGQATISYAYRNESGYQFQTYMTHRQHIDYEGIPLVLIPAEEKSEADESIRTGFSNAAKFWQAQKFSSAAGKPKDNMQNFVVMNVVTDGEGRIIEIAAVKDGGEAGSTYSRLIEYEGRLPDKVKEKTGITEEMLYSKGMPLYESLKQFVDFVGEAPIVGYSMDEGMTLINEALEKAGELLLKNDRYDLRKYVKKEKMFLSDYRLESVLAAYDIEGQASNRALADVDLIYDLAMKVNKFLKSLGAK